MRAKRSSLETLTANHRRRISHSFASSLSKTHGKIGLSSTSNTTRYLVPDKYSSLRSNQASNFRKQSNPGLKNVLDIGKRRHTTSTLSTGKSKFFGKKSLISKAKSFYKDRRVKKNEHKSSNSKNRLSFKRKSHHTDLSDSLRNLETSRKLQKSRRSSPCALSNSSYIMFNSQRSSRVSHNDRMDIRSVTNIADNSKKIEVLEKTVAEQKTLIDVLMREINQLKENQLQ
jgi:hypothetical protein